MLLPSFVLLASFAFPGQEATQAPVRISLGELDPEVTMLMLGAQLGDEVPVEVDGKFLVVQGDEATQQSVREAIAQLSLPAKSPVEFLPAPKNSIPLMVDGESRSLMELVDDYVQQTGVAAFVPKNLRERLERTPLEVDGVSSLEPKQAVHHLEVLLAQSNVSISLNRVHGEVCIQLEATNRSMGLITLAASPFVPEKHLSRYANHPAVQICTALHLRNTDIRSLSNTVRQLIVNPNTQQIVPAGSSHVLLINGPGAWVFELAKMLRLTDALNAQRAQEQAKQRTPILEVFAIQHTEPAAMAVLVKDLLAPAPSQEADPAPKRRSSRLPKEPETKVLVDPRTRSIAVLCTPAKMVQVQALIAELDIE